MEAESQKIVSHRRRYKKPKLSRCWFCNSISMRFPPPCGRQVPRGSHTTSLPLCDTDVFCGPSHHCFVITSNLNILYFSSIKYAQPQFWKGLDWGFYVFYLKVTFSCWPTPEHLPVCVPTPDASSQVPMFCSTRFFIFSSLPKHLPHLSPGPSQIVWRGGGRVKTGRRKGCNQMDPEIHSCYSEKWCYPCIPHLPSSPPSLLFACLWFLFLSRRLDNTFSG